MKKPYNRPAGGGKKTSQPRLWREGNAPLSPPAAVLPPMGEVLAALMLDMLMSSEAQRRANLPLRGRCRRQKGCISSGPQARLYGFRYLRQRCRQRWHTYSSPRSGDTTTLSGQRPLSNLKTLKTFGPKARQPSAPKALSKVIPHPPAKGRSNASIKNPLRTMGAGDFLFT